MPKQVFLFLTHLTDRQSNAELSRIKKAVPEGSEVFMLFHCHGHKQPSFTGNIHKFTDRDLEEIGFPMLSETIVPGSGHFPVMAFRRQYPEYAFYWVIEYDVRFRGNWEKFFTYYQASQADLLTCHIRNYHEEPDWCWWKLRHPDKEIPLQQRYRSFNPIYRISANALDFIDRMHREQWTGHYEELVPTLLFHNGYQLQDIGGTGSFVKKGDRNRFYIDSPESRRGRLKKGTMRFRPSFTRPGWRWNKLYHPVKRPADSS
ncbi:hypothetical protein Pcar_2294 [Syntrophotalea carbinolica DSM 2380]|uniref:DUF3405 domain-containing protein n=2 Tax=Syntrophotalea carbinolica TaxID=19 RepID=Q3A274_SYNC1|nr:hypothetical protein Pcar_2294 [Syntrophotalea carbinolica DSM 2380]